MPVPELRVHNLSISLDGYVAGPDQDLEHPLGVGGEALHRWVFASAAGQRMLGQDVTAGEGPDDRFIVAGETGIGATIIGRNMFGPVRGDWATWGPDPWDGWWGPEPPYHHPVFVLTHHARAPLEMEGGTTFHFVTDGIHSALERATDAAGSLDVRLGGGAATVQQYLRAGLVDDLHLAVAPVLLGSGERLFDHLDGGPVGYHCVEMGGSGSVTHVRMRRD